MSKHFVLLILIGIIVIAAGIRLYGIDKQSLWFDEIYEETAFQRQFLLDKPSSTPNTPPLNSFFIYPITRMFPANDFALRIPSFTFGLISIALFFLLGKRLFNEKVGLIASFLLAISPFHIWYSQDARMYALQWMLSLVSLIYFLRSLERPCRGNYIGFVISNTACLYTHQLAVFLLLLQGLYLLFFFRKYKEQFFKWVCAFSTIVILYLPWIIYIASSVADRKAGIAKEIDYKLILYTIFTFCGGFSTGPSLKELHTIQFPAVIKSYVTVIGSLMTVYCSIFMLGLWSVRKDRPKLLFILLLLIIPIIGIVILNKHMPNITYNVRYTGTALFAFLLFIANGVDFLTCLKSKLLGRMLAVFAVIAITGFSIYSYANYQFDKRYQKADFRGTAAYINEKIMSDDTVLCVMSDGIINRYSKGGFMCTKFMIRSTKDNKILTSVMQKIVEGKKRIWLVSSREWYMSSIVEVKEWLTINYEEIKHLHKGSNEIANVNVYCYDLTKKKTTQN